MRTMDEIMKILPTRLMYDMILMFLKRYSKIKEDTNANLIKATIRNGIKATII